MFWPAWAVVWLAAALAALAAGGWAGHTRASPWSGGAAVEGARQSPVEEVGECRRFAWMVPLAGPVEAAAEPVEAPVGSTSSPMEAEPAEAVRIAVIGDYGDASRAAADVAALVKSWQPDIVVTTGDNNYPSGAAETIDRNVGRFYSQFIAPYRGRHGPGGTVNRFFPTLGNHDWDAAQGVGRLPQPYLDYFTLPPGPGEERYYEVVWGPVHIFAVDSDYREPHGTTADSRQAQWLRQALARSTAAWKLVVMHEPPYSSGRHGSTPRLRWPFKAWGATAVLSGHDHTYERLVIDGFPYFVNGLGGQSRYRFREPLPGSQVRYNADSGAMLIEATPQRITFRFVTRRGETIDVYRIERPAEAFSPLRPTAVRRHRHRSRSACSVLTQHQGQEAARRHPTCAGVFQVEVGGVTVADVRIANAVEGQ
ncbi:MAG: metallophosphoesterase [Caldilineales bacterium]|nr:metallophosphoesterase [Caldilineales bacterium]